MSIQVNISVNVEEFLKLYKDSDHVRPFTLAGIEAILTRIEADQSEQPEAFIEWTSYFINALSYPSLADLLLEQTEGSQSQVTLVDTLEFWLTFRDREETFPLDETRNKKMLTLALTDPQFKSELVEGWIDTPIEWSNILDSENGEVIYLT